LFTPIWRLAITGCVERCANSTQNEETKKRYPFPLKNPTFAVYNEAAKIPVKAATNPLPKWILRATFTVLP
jgi:hypothetical protein